MSLSNHKGLIARLVGVESRDRPLEVDSGEFRMCQWLLILRHLIALADRLREGHVTYCLTLYYPSKGAVLDTTESLRVFDVVIS